MKALDTSPIVSGVGYPPSKKGFDFLWLSNKEMLNVLAQTFGGEVVANAAYVLYGCQKTDLGAGNFSFAKGAIYDSKSGEIYLLDAVTSIAIATAPVMAITTTFSGTYNTVKFTDGTLKTVHQERKLVISDGALNSKDINYADLIFTQQTKIKSINIGDWNMNVSVAGAATKAVAHGIADYTKIRNISVFIRTDGPSITPPGYGASVVVMDLKLVTFGTGLTHGGVAGFDNTNVQLAILTGGAFDNNSFDSTSYNRGFVVIEYVQ